jgi:hypothetical protein
MLAGQISCCLGSFRGLQGIGEHRITLSQILDAMESVRGIGLSMGTCAGSFTGCHRIFPSSDSA